MATKKERIRRGASAIVFRMRKGQPEFLLLHRVKRWIGWEILKGGRIGRESPVSTLMRELKEEINAEKHMIGSIIPISSKMKFRTPPEYVKKYRYTRMEFQVFLVEYYGKVSIQNNDIKEHDGYRWASFKDSMKLLTYESSKKQLKLAYSLVKKGKF